MNFTQTLQEIRKGNVLRELDESMANLVKEVQRTGKSGSITLKLNLKSSGDMVAVEEHVSAKLPRMNQKAALFFTDDEGGLHRDNPDQRELPFTVVPFTVVPTPAAAIPASEAAPQPVQQAAK